VERENTSVVAKKDRRKKNTTGTQKVIEDDHSHTHTKIITRHNEEDLF
jgi:hypothetical protein